MHLMMGMTWKSNLKRRIRTSNSRMLLKMVLHCCSTEAAGAEHPSMKNLFVKSLITHATKKKRICWLTIKMEKDLLVKFDLSIHLLGDTGV